MELGECKSTFNLEKAVCNHGFFMMAPNNWIPSTKTLQRPLRLSDDTTSAVVSISHPPCHSFLLVKILLHSQFPHPLPDRHAILAQVGRMLRISDRDERDVREFQKACPKAKARGFGRLFRSPSIFEDAVKSILLCNCTWSKSLQMAQALCELQFDLTNTRKGKGKRKRGKSSTPLQAEVRMGNFPTSKELASLEESYLREKYPVLGYRAKYILQLAKNVESGRVSLQEMEETMNKEPYDYERVYQELSHLNGFGPYTCANVFMCIGNYQSVPVDTETIRHIQQVHGRKTCDKKTVKKQVEEIYDKFAPFQCLAYWMELLDSYEDKFGKLSFEGLGSLSSLFIVEDFDCIATQMFIYSKRYFEGSAEESIFLGVRLSN
nr:uncharacterized protein LOC107434191 [Ziziphus jujuba var. spinosa]